jgi:hypothetical protein
MPALASDLRKTLETTVVKARELAERGARDALTALAVGASEPFASMSEEERKPRNRLRARGRQLGDQRDAQKGTQTIERLVREMAYEHWHRMLFARFLAENQLLIEPSSGVSISLDECEELAAEEGTDLWGLAAQFAQAMLPQIFRVDDPVLAAKLPLEIRQQLQGLIAGLAEEIFTASDSLGWVYQFWQAPEKDRVNQAETKIGADELPAVTQLFTEPYMVDFLLHNSLGAWWVTRHPDKPCPVELSYLRTLEDGTPAAGTFEGWPNTLKEFTLLDPCCGSGHFLVAAFLLLVPMRMASEGLSASDAVDAVLAENLHGLELDARCVEIAVFALALAAWSFPGENGKPLGVRKAMPNPQVACCGLKLGATTEQWKALVPAEAPDGDRLRAGLAHIHRAFSQAPFLGSLLHPARAGEANLLAAGSYELAEFLGQALRNEQPMRSGGDKDQAVEMALAARGVLDAARLLDDRYNLVITNVPYKNLSELSEDLKALCSKEYPDIKGDIANMFLERCLELSQQKDSGAIQVVTPQNWLFLRTYRKQRESLLRRVKWNLLARLGPGAFETIGGEVVQAILLTQTNANPAEDSIIHEINVSEHKIAKKKAEMLRNAPLIAVVQKSQLNNPNMSISLEELQLSTPLEYYASCFQGASTLDIVHFRRQFWEIFELRGWELHMSTPDGSAPYTGMEFVSMSREKGGEMEDFAMRLKAEGYLGGWLSGNKAWGRRGVAVSWMGNLPASLYTGCIYDNMAAVIIPKSPELIDAIWAYCSSPQYNIDVRKINQKNQVANATLAQVTFNLDYWSQVSAERYPNGIPKPFSDSPTQWLFHGHPRSSHDPLQVAVARLVGYRWPAEFDSLIEYSDEAKEWIAQCEDLASHADDDGIVCLSSVRGESAAHERLSKLLGSAFADDWSSAKERELLLATAVANNARKPEASVEAWLRNSFFSEHCKLFQSRPFVWQVWDGNPTGFSALVNAHKLAAPNGQGRKTLELLTFTYLGDWIDRQKLHQSNGVSGADDRLAAALDLQGQLEKILDGEPPYDIFVRWKPLHQQAIGWDPDINDGVRLNIRPFLNAQLRKGGKTGAGILRAKPGTIKWAKDRGKEPMRSKEDFPWFWGWDENDPVMNASDPTKCANFGAPPDITVGQGLNSRYKPVPAGDSFDGNRWNDLHYTRAAKEAARSRHRGEG